MTNQLKIRVQCKCGQTYAVSSQMVGKKVKCKACSAVFVCAEVAKKKPKTAPQPVQQTKPCESCGATLRLEKIICTACNYNHRTKKKAKQSDPYARVKASSQARQKQRKQTKQTELGKSNKVKSKPIQKERTGSFLGINFHTMFTGIATMILGLALLVVGLVIRGFLVKALEMITNGFLTFFRGLRGRSY